MYPVPDSTRWLDDGGNTWTSHGADITVTAGDLEGEFEVTQL